MFDLKEYRSHDHVYVCVCAMGYLDGTSFIPPSCCFEGGTCHVTECVFVCECVKGEGGDRTCCYVLLTSAPCYFIVGAWMICVRCPWI